MHQDTIATLTPTVCRLMGIPAPELASRPGLEPVARRASTVFGHAGAQRCLVYCPDALGDHI